MPVLPYASGRTIVGRLRHGADLLMEITRVANEYGIGMGTVTGLGGLKRGAVAFLNQTTQQYERIEFDEPMEITALVGNISRLKQRAFPHIHVTLSDRAGNARGGHLVQGCEIWACEIMIHESIGGILSRDFDESTGLSLWPDSSVL